MTDMADLPTNAAVIRSIAEARPLTAEAPLPLFRPLPSAPDFPVTALGPILAPAARAIAGQAQCAMACAANSILAVASLAAQGRANALLPIGPHGKPTPLSLYLLTVLESGERKSTADSLALKPVRDFERELTEAYQGERQAYTVKATAYDVAAKRLQSKFKDNRAALESALNDLGPAPSPPLLTVIAPGGDQTFEGLFRIYERGRPSLAMLCDDGATFLGGHSLKAENKASTTANLCRAWDGQRLERIRSLDGVSVLYDRRLAVHIMVQPGVAGEFLSDARFADQGLLARFLLAAPPSLDGTKARMRDENAEAERALAMQAAHDLAPYNQAIGTLLRAGIRWKNEADRAAGVNMDALDLTPEARALYVQFSNAVGRKLGPNGELATIKPFASKLAENAVRLAGVLTLMSDDRATAIDGQTLAQAIELAEYYAAEALRLIDAANVAPDLKRADAVLQWMRSRNRRVFGLAEIYQYGPKTVRTAKAARAAMQTLADHRQATALPDGAEIDGKRHREAWRLERGAG